MPNSRSLSSYSDVKAVLDSALEAGLPSEYHLASRSAAIRWRSRANTFRQLTASPAYAHLCFAMPRDQEGVVVITANEVGRLVSPEGKEIAVGAKAEPTAEEQEAAALLKELGL